MTMHALGVPIELEAAMGTALGFRVYMVVVSAGCDLRVMGVLIGKFFKTAEMWSGSEEGSYVRLIDCCITQRQARE